MSKNPPSPCPAPSHRLWLQRVQLLNFRCFDTLTVDLDKQLTVLIARNGAGKTALLDAIVTLLGTFVGSFYTGKGAGIHISDVRMAVTNTQPLEMSPQYPTVLSARGEVHGRYIHWERRLNTPKSGTTIREAKPLTSIGKEMQDAESKGKQVVLPLIAYYGTGRLWNLKKKTTRKLHESYFHDRTAGYLDCLDPASSYKYFDDWFRYAARVVGEARMRRLEGVEQGALVAESSYVGLIQAIQKAVDICLRMTGWHSLRYSFLHQGIVMEHPRYGVLEIGQLSDGVRNMIAMVADIAHRMVQLNAQFGGEAATRTPGLVLIDEVDMHLHPEWQQAILAQLTVAFPQVQFVVTTHSPQVLSTVPRENVRVLAEDLDGRFIAAMPHARTYGRSNADVMQAVMGVDPQPKTPDTEELRKYLARVEQGDPKDHSLQALRKELERIFGPDHPSLIKADMSMRRREALGP